MPDLLNVDEALSRILADFQRLRDEHIPLDNALNRVLSQPIIASFSLPPFDNSSMDGFAVRADDLEGAAANFPVRLRVIGDIQAGSTPTFTVNRGEAARIMTGAAMPNGADAVIPMEDTDARWRSGDSTAFPVEVVVYKSLRRGDSVRFVGEDMQSGEIILNAGELITPAALGVMAALGVAQVPVIRQPRVAIISSGDELVPVGQPLGTGQIHDVNSYTLSGLIAQYGGIVQRIPPARDTLADVRRAFQAAIDGGADIILSSAGVSVGTVDLVRSVLEEMGELSFWRVNLRPGKPLAYGRINGIPFFGLPGNPVSAMVTFDVFVRPVLLKLGGRADHPETVAAALSEDITSDGRRAYIRVKLNREQDRWIARLTGTQSSGAISSMVKADGLLILPDGVTHAPAGSVYSVRLLRPLP